MPTRITRGRLERYDYEYERCGVCTIFMASEPLAQLPQFHIQGGLSLNVMFTLHFCKSSYVGEDTGQAFATGSPVPLSAG